MVGVFLYIFSISIFFYRIIWEAQQQQAGSQAQKEGMCVKSRVVLYVLTFHDYLQKKIISRHYYLLIIVFSWPLLQ